MICVGQLAWPSVAAERDSSVTLFTTIAEGGADLAKAGTGDEVECIVFTVDTIGSYGELCRTRVSKVLMADTR